jgi:hypothetical protein
VLARFVGVTMGRYCRSGEPALGLDGKISVKVLRTRNGRKQVMQLLGRIDQRFELATK